MRTSCGITFVDLDDDDNDGADDDDVDDGKGAADAIASSSSLIMAALLASLVGIITIEQWWSYVKSWWREGMANNDVEDVTTWDQKK